MKSVTSVEEAMGDAVMWMKKMEKCKSVDGPISLSAGEKSFVPCVSVT